jgi:hypothetical protein
MQNLAIYYNTGYIHTCDSDDPHGLVSSLVFNSITSVAVPYETMSRYIIRKFKQKQIWYSFELSDDGPILCQYWDNISKVPKNAADQIVQSLEILWNTVSSDPSADQVRILVSFKGNDFCNELNDKRRRLLNEYRKQVIFEQKEKIRLLAERQETVRKALLENLNTQFLKKKQERRQEILRIKELPRLDIAQIDRIKEFCEIRKITQLYHFTSLQNLHSILEYGLLGREYCEQIFDGFSFTDEYRFDRQTKSICLSIGYPNYKMFKQKRDNFPEKSWALLTLDAYILCGFDCSFCDDNASRRKYRIDGTTYKSLNTPEHLMGMFSENNRIVKEPHFTTNPQAEVLVYGRIPPECIKSIHFEQKAPSINTNLTMIENSQFFASRYDWKHWQLMSTPQETE